MKRILTISVSLTSSLASWCVDATSVKALPGMSATEVVNWSRSITTIAPLNPVRQYESGMPNFDSSTNLMGGTVRLSAFLDQDGSVEITSLDYRPACGTQFQACSGSVRFEKADRNNGSKLIRTIMGQEVLADFRASRLIDTIRFNGTQRWYQGRLYNYTTWHYSDPRISHSNTIVHFSVVSKQISQAEQIETQKRCMRNPRSCGP